MLTKCVHRPDLTTLFDFVVETATFAFEFSLQRSQDHAKRVCTKKGLFARHAGSSTNLNLAPSGQSDMNELMQFQCRLKAGSHPHRGENRFHAKPESWGFAASPITIKSLHHCGFFETTFFIF